MYLISIKNPKKGLTGHFLLLLAVHPQHMLRGLLHKQLLPGSAWSWGTKVAGDGLAQVDVGIDALAAEAHVQEEFVVRNGRDAGVHLLLSGLALLALRQLHQLHLGGQPLHHADS
jgi:hypothetical protein